MMTYKQISSEDRRAAAIAFNEGVEAFKANDEERAISLWKIASTRDPSLSVAYRNLVVFFEKAGDEEQVIKLYEALLKENPVDTASLIRQASAFKRLGRYEAAVKNYRKAISVYPYFRFWYSELSEIFKEMGAHKQAEIWNTRAEELDADAAEMAFNDGVRSLQEKNYPLAKACFDAILEDYPANLDARLHYARTQIGLEDYEGALTSYEEALTFTDVAQGLVHFNRANLLIRLNRKQEASVELELAIDYEPKFTRAHRLFNLLKTELSSPTSAPILPKAGSSKLNARSQKYSTSALGSSALNTSKVSLNSSQIGAPGRGSIDVQLGSTQEKRSSQQSYSSRLTSARSVSQKPSDDDSASRSTSGRGNLRKSSSKQGQSKYSRPSSSKQGSRPTSNKRSQSVDSDVLELDFIEKVPAYKFIVPHSRYKWDQQLHAVFTQALRIPSPGGGEPCIALLVEPVQQIATAMTHMLVGIKHPSYGLWRKTGPSRIMFAESNPTSGKNPIRRAGWMGNHTAIGTEISRWRNGKEHFPIDQMIDVTAEQGGKEGFNLVLILSTGRISGDEQSTLQSIKRLRAHQVIYLRPQRHFADLGLRMQPIAPHWFEITLPF